MRLIYYSVVFTADGKYDRQWIHSIRSLRSHNQEIPVALFVLDQVSDSVAREAQRHHVEIVSLGSQREWLRGRPHPRAELLASYPTLHNLLVLTTSDVRDVTQALYVDCDTFFFRDPQLLFEQCCQHEWYAREIPGSRLSATGSTRNLDEMLFDAIAGMEGLHRTAAFNTGVCLLNRAVWNKLAALEDVLLDYAWRLLVGMHCRKSTLIQGKVWQAPGLRAATADNQERLRALVVSAATSTDIERALPYPSDNWWILDEVAWMLAAGRVDSLSQGLFTTHQVALGNEYASIGGSESLPIMAHYFSHYETEFFEHIRDRVSVLHQFRESVYVHP